MELERRGTQVRNHRRKREREKETGKRLLDIPLSWTQLGLGVTPGKCKGLFPPSLEAGIIPSLPSITLILGQWASAKGSWSFHQNLKPI